MNLSNERGVRKSSVYPDSIKIEKFQRVGGWVGEGDGVNVIRASD